MENNEPVCVCLAELREKLKREHHTNIVYIDRSYLVTGWKEYVYTTRERLFKRLSKRWKWSAVRFKFCPFCGRRYMTKMLFEVARG